jgi:hypothetical protein
MTNVFPLAMLFNEKVQDNFKLALANKGFANSLAPLMMEKKHFEKNYYDIFGDRGRRLFAEVPLLAMTLSKTFIYAREISFPFSSYGNYQHINVPISEFRPSIIDDFSFKMFSMINRSCLHTLKLNNKETTNNEIIIKNFKDVYIKLYGPALGGCKKLQKFKLSGTFQRINIGIFLSDEYLTSLNKILEDVVYCDFFIFYPEYFEKEPDEYLDFSFAQKCVYLFTHQETIPKCLLKENLENLYICGLCSHETSSEIDLCSTNINLSFTKLILEARDELRENTIKVKLNKSKSANIETNFANIEFIDLEQEIINIEFSKNVNGEKIVDMSNDESLEIETKYKKLKIINAKKSFKVKLVF